MTISVEIPIQGSKEEIWKIIADIENSVTNISGIEKVEIHHHPGESLVGLKWTETRTLFGKTATETMWITEAEKNQYYQTRAESHGSIYITVMRIVENNEGTLLSMEFTGKPQSLGAKIMAGMLMPFFKNATKKALYQDLLDIKKAVETEG